VPSAASSRARDRTPSRAHLVKQDTGARWHGPCFRGQRRIIQMYSILYIIGAIVVIVVVLRVLGLI
jgi:hypothetical protein